MIQKRQLYYFQREISVPEIQITNKLEETELNNKSL